MAHQCPRCQGPVSRSYSNTAQATGGLVALMLVAAFGPYRCAKCGKISKSEFPPEVRSKMMGGTIALIVGAIALFILVTVLIVAWNQ